MSWKKPRFLNDDIDNLRKEILENPSEDKLQYLEYLLKLRWLTMLYEKTSFITLSDLKKRGFKKMNKETILKEYEDTIQRRFDLFMLIENFDTNTQFSHSSFDLLCLLEQNLCQNLKILEMIARTENILEILDIERKYFDKLTFSGN